MIIEFFDENSNENLDENLGENLEEENNEDYNDDVEIDIDGNDTDYFNSLVENAEAITTVKIIRGNSERLTILPYEYGELGEKTPIEIGINDVMKFTVKKRAGVLSPVIFEKIITSINRTSDGKYMIDITSYDTLNLPSGVYFYDCAINRNGYFKTVILPTPFIITEICTEPFGDFSNSGNSLPKNLEGVLTIPSYMINYYVDANAFDEFTTDILNRINNIENTTITTINNSFASINNTISMLNISITDINNRLTALENDGINSELIDYLSERVYNLEYEITTLKDTSFRN
jgi:hypothetical protein